MASRVVACALLIAATFRLSAQEALNDALLPSNDSSLTSPGSGEAIVEIPTSQDQPTIEISADQGSQTLELQSKSKETRPESAWLDLRQNTTASSTTQSAPSWVEAVAITSAPGENSGATPKTSFRIRVTHPPGDYQVLFFRLFFQDTAAARPELIAWDESGTAVLRSGALGAGIDLPGSDSVMIPMTGISCIDIDVPGDGKTVRGAYLDWMTSSEVVHPLNAEHRDIIPEPFSVIPPLRPSTQDTEQFGTVTATLAADIIRIGSEIQDGARFQFGIESQPLLAVLTFEVANPRIDSPPEIYLNGQDIGPVSLALPELADPGYRGAMEPIVRQMHFQYTGWLRAQKIVPVTSR